MRALITGASGFVGRALVSHLLEIGDEVIEHDRVGGGPDLIDRTAMFDLVGEAAPHVIYHLAAQSHVPTSWSDPIGTLRTNVEGTQNVLDAAAEVDVRRVLVVSSAEVYGSVDQDRLPITEEFPLLPRTPYAASKVGADALALQAFLGRGQDVVRLRAFNHIGPGQRTAFVCAGIAHRIARAERDGTTSIEIGALDVRRDFTDVRDVVRAYRLTAEHGAAGEAYNVCSGVDRSIGELAETLIEQAGKSFTLSPIDDLIRTIDTPIVRGDNTKIRAQTGWEPSISITRSLREILNDARERLDASGD
jgi:GDP-4-dehydro-6-deoxy-D-mannose reductase